MSNLNITNPISKQMARKPRPRVQNPPTPQQRTIPQTMTPLIPVQSNQPVPPAPPLKTYAQVVQAVETDPKVTLAQDTIQTTPVVLTTNEAVVWKTPCYKEVGMPTEWMNDENQAGINRIIVRGVVIAAPTLMMSGKERDLPLGKVLIKIWNPYNKEDSIGQGQATTIFVTGFEDVAEAIGKFTVGDIVEVTGSLRTHAYQRKITGTPQPMEIKTYDTSLIARGLTKYKKTEDEQDWTYPEYEEQHPTLNY